MGREQDLDTGGWLEDLCQGLTAWPWTSHSLPPQFSIDQMGVLSNYLAGLLWGHTQRRLWKICILKLLCTIENTVAIEGLRQPPVIRSQNMFNLTNKIESRILLFWEWWHLLTIWKQSQNLTFFTGFLHGPASSHKMSSIRARHRQFTGREFWRLHFVLSKPLSF